VTKKGYSVWEKNLPVASALTTFAEGIVLWKLEAPQALASTPAETLNQTELGMLDRSDPLTYKNNSEPLKATASRFGSRIRMAITKPSRASLMRLSPFSPIPTAAG